jgi:hypothetical protein
MRRAGVLVILLAATEPAAGERPDQLPEAGGQPGPMRKLLFRKEVQNELKLSAAQARLSLKVIDHAEMRYVVLYAAANEVKDPNQRTEAVLAVRKVVTAEVRKLLPQAIGVPATKRLLQLEVRLHRLSGFTIEPYRSMLELTEDQDRQIGVIQVKLLKAQGDAPKPDDVEGWKKWHAAEKEATEKARALLTDKQKKVWDDLVGPPFVIRP